MAKNNQRSIRYDDEVAELIERVEGNNFNEKFENIVRDYFLTEEKRNAKIKVLDRKIKDREKQLYEINQQIQQSNLIISKFKSFLQYIEYAKNVTQ